MNGYGGVDANQFVGNGFVNSPAAGGPQSGAGMSPEVKGKVVSTLRSLTVKQLFQATSNAPDDQYRLDGHEICDVTLVGKVLGLGSNALNLEIMLDDGTGVIELRYWLDTENDAQMRAECQPGTYVRAHGQLRSFEGKVHMLAFTVRPITDFNEVTHHYLSCIFQHLHLTKGKGGGAAPAAAVGGAAAGFGGAAPMGGGGGFGGAGAMGGATNQDGLTHCQAEVLSFFNNAESAKGDQGASLQEVVSVLNGRFPRDQLEQAVEFLMNEGHVYTTVDEHHYKSTAM